MLTLQRQIGNRGVAAVLSRRAAPRRVLAREVDDESWGALQQRLVALYRALSRPDRVDLKANGTVAVGLATEGGVPVWVYTTAGNRGSAAFHRAAEDLGLMRWQVDAGVAARSSGSTQHGPRDPVPPGMGGIQHAEQLMLDYARDHGYVLHGMVVSRPLCRDCPSVVKSYRGGRLTIGVLQDPDETYENPRDARWRTKQGGQGGGTPRNRKPPARDNRTIRSGPDPMRPAGGGGNRLRAGKGLDSRPRRRSGAAPDISKVPVRVAIRTRLAGMPNTRMGIHMAKATGWQAVFQYAFDWLNWKLIHEDMMKAKGKEIEDAIQATITRRWDEAVANTTKAPNSHWYFNVHISSGSLTLCNDDRMCSTTPFLSLKSVELQAAPMDLSTSKHKPDLYASTTSDDTYYSISVDDLIQQVREAEQWEDDTASYAEWAKQHPEHPLFKGRGDQERDADQLEWDRYKGVWKSKRR